MAYDVEGDLLEVCNCNVLCPCWIGEDPDNGTCDTIIGYKFHKGTIDGVDMAGRAFAILAHVPGNILKGNWKIAVLIDDKASDKQQEAILAAWTGKLGGPLADLAKLVGEVAAVERAPITFEIVEGKGTLKVGDVLDTEMAPYTGATGKVTTLNDSVFSTIPGAPAYVSKASKYVRKSKKYGLADMNMKGYNAIQGKFRFVA
jgi:hypothetical protein